MLDTIQYAEAIRHLRNSKALRLFYQEVAAMALADGISYVWRQISGSKLDETDALHLARIAMKELPDQSWIAIGSWFRAQDGDYKDHTIFEADTEILVYRLVDLGYL